MTYTFAASVPADISLVPLLISGPGSLPFDGQEFLLLHQDDGSTTAYEIRYEYHCSPFKAAIVEDHLLAVGHEAFFYLFNISTGKHLLSHRLSGYFGHLYLDNGLFYVADADGITCINQQGEILWDNHQLGIDGVTIESFSADRISGSGEWNPPGGWRKFILEKKTGELHWCGTE
jgi:hypothetical protein